jgi:glycerophosphoryl diester phosphodiesterase
MAIPTLVRVKDGARNQPEQERDPMSDQGDPMLAAMPPPTDAWSLAEAWCSARAALRGNLRTLLAYELLWKLLTFAALGPLSVALVHALIRLSGETSVANTDLVSFVLSPLGIGTLVVFAMISVALVFVERAGLFRLLYGRMRERPLALATVLRSNGRDAPALLGIALLEVLIGLACAVPFVALVGLTYFLLLSGSDINYALATRPPSFLLAVGIGIVLGLGAATLFAVLYLRWAFAVPVCLFEGKRGAAALRGSAALTAGRRWRVLGVLLTWLVFRTVGSQLALFGLYRLNDGLLAALGEPGSGVMWRLELLLVLDAVLVVGLSLLDTVGHSLLLTLLYKGLRRWQGEAPPARALPGDSGDAPAKVGRARLLGAAGVVTAAVLLGGWQAHLVVRRFTTRQALAVTAHRAGALRAPENTLAALRLAIAEGADFAEIDVQETADGALLVLHDQDLRRLAGVPRNVWELTLAEVKAFDLGATLGPQFQGERLATLGEFIDTARGRIKLNIELKYNGHDQRLAERVMDLLQQQHFGDQVVISSLSAAGLAEVRRRDPHLRIGYIVGKSVGDITGLDVDFLSLHQKEVTPRLLRQAGARGLPVHAWTVNRREDMVRLLSLGVENLITDDPALAVEVVRWFEQLSDEELVLLRFHHWLRS